MDSLDELEAAALPLAGIVLHLSRSGSTLVARALAQLPRLRVLNEPQQLDEALTAARRGDDPSLSGVRRALAALGAPDGVHDRYLIKADSWHVLALDTLLRAVPELRWLFVYRDPAEVLASHLAQPGSQTVPGVLPESWFGSAKTALPSEHAVAVIAAMCAAILPFATSGTLLNYDELPEALADRVPRHFGLPPIDVTKLGDVLTQHAKRPDVPFVPDREWKQAAVPPELRAELEAAAYPTYRALESLRRGSGS
ncbi:hypothetical protein [Jatrophihabitans sp.]|uniref:hypothetical protein n=1 Tax=Jatrophihabitans sp. TaxID=1932789 RepID=UPI0030C7615B|nr:aspartyl/asparaginyl beta-hydroxylase [Jatrophihabitans sp.]